MSDATSRGGPEREALFRAFFEQRDPGARDRLVAEFLPLVQAIARRYAGRGEPLEDLVQVGSIGLIKAIDRFDPERGVAFENYAVPTIVGEIKRHFRDQAWAAHVPRRLKELNTRFSVLIDDLTAQLGRQPTVAELAAAAQVDKEDVIDALESRQSYRAISLSQPIGDDDEDELIDTIEANDHSYETVDDRFFLAGGLEALDARRRRILYLCFYEGLTQSQIAQEMKISQMQVSRLIRSSLEKIGKAIESDELAE